MGQETGAINVQKSHYRSPNCETVMCDASKAIWRNSWKWMHWRWFIAIFNPTHLSPAFSWILPHSMHIDGDIEMGKMWRFDVKRVEIPINKQPKYSHMLHNWDVGRKGNNAVSDWMCGCNEGYCKFPLFPSRFNNASSDPTHNVITNYFQFHSPFIKHFHWGWECFCIVSGQLIVILMIFRLAFSVGRLERKLNCFYSR